MSKDADRSFAELIGRVRRLDHEGIEPAAPRPPARRRPRDDDAPAAAEPWSDRPHLHDPRDDDHDAGDYQRNGVQRGIVRKLRRGQFPLVDELDLYGRTLAEARGALAAFLAHARGPRLTCVRVIHGKGLSSPGYRPVLKPRVREWLREDARVLAFTAARDADGGSGALYVLLRARDAEGRDG
ncbi:MAG: Smr/MutS family protein [Gammaproteobacteria bacterium]